MRLHERRGTGVHHLHLGVVGDGIERGHETVAGVAGSERRQIDNVLGRTEGRCVGQIQLREVVNGQSAHDGRCHHVQTLVHTEQAGHLRTEDPADFRVPEQFEQERSRAGIVTGVMVVVDGHASIRMARSTEVFLRPTGQPSAPSSTQK